MGNRVSSNELPGIGEADSIPVYSYRSGTGGNGFFENLVTKKQLAQTLAVSEGFINKLMIEEGLPHFKIGRAVRYRVKEVVSWLSQRRRP
jgi:excisionase family DNA binding protein